VAHSFETSAEAACAAIRERDVSAQELTSRFLARIEAGNGSLGAIRHVMVDQAIEAARALDAKIEAGERLPPLAGLPVVVKENCDTAGVPCSAGLEFLADHVPTADSAITARLRAAGAIILGVSVSDPGAFSVRTFDVTHPADPALTVGGSSGGSAAALAAGFCLGAIGTDTGGSIRIPSACCGTVGLKPTYGALPMDGIFPLVKSLDHVGPMGRSVGDVRLLWHALADQVPEPASEPQRIGYDPAWVEIADRPIRDAFALGLKRLRDQGLSVVEISLPDLDEVVAMHGQIFLVEAAAYHCAHHGENIGSYPAIAREWFAIARDMGVGAYVDACAKRVVMTGLVDQALGKVDAIMTPSLCVARPRKDAGTVTITGVEHDYTMGLVRLTCLFDHTGHPAIAFPVPGTPDALTSSLQVIGPHQGEEMLSRLADRLARETIS
jgi:Asp-tRNA(Asn)/Glu-tRNA(Gln) amidotransferase A subunit family amidase